MLSALAPDIYWLCLLRGICGVGLSAIAVAAGLPMTLSLTLTLILALTLDTTLHPASPSYPLSPHLRAPLRLHDRVLPLEEPGSSVHDTHGILGCANRTLTLTGVCTGGVH